ncbi:Low-density lipoprotein receptor-related protein 2 [Porites harrisoni]
MMRIVVNLCLTFCFLLEESSGGLNFTRLPGDPWVEDQENGSLPVFASCQALSPPSFKQPSWKLPCRQGQFRCADAPPCISMGKRCDGHTDCINGDDEPFSCSDPWVEDQENGSLPSLATCPALSPPSFTDQPSWQLPCRKGQFRCADAPPCISMGKRCGHNDRISGEDEPFSFFSLYSCHTFRLHDYEVFVAPMSAKEVVLHINKSSGNEERVIQFSDDLEEPKELKDLDQHAETYQVNVAFGDYSGALYFQLPGSIQESRVERTLDVNTWLLIIILLLLVLVLGKRVFKKVYSWLFIKATHPGDVQGTRAEDQERTVTTEEGFATGNTDIMHESALLLNYDDESPELNQQVCTAETKGACVHRGDLPFQVQGDLVVYMNMNTVNMNTVSMNMNTTNNVELQQNGGVTVVGDKTNINYHQPPQ